MKKIIIILLVVFALSLVTVQSEPITDDTRLAELEQRVELLEARSAINSVGVCLNLAAIQPLYGVEPTGIEACLANLDSYAEMLLHPPEDTTGQS